MGLMDRIKKVTGTNESYDDSYEDDYYDGFESYDDAGEENSDAAFAGGAAPVNPAPNANTQMGGNMGAPVGGGISLSGSNIKMQVVRPRTYDSDTTTQIANHLLNKCTVVLNLENTNRETSRRLIDFLTGVAYSIGGNLKQIATNAYVITPSNVDVENSQIKPRRPEPQPEPKDNPADDFNDFN